MPFRKGLPHESSERHAVARPVLVLQGVLYRLEGPALVERPEGKGAVKHPSSHRKAIESSRDTHLGRSFERLEALGTEGEPGRLRSRAAPQTAWGIDDVE